MAAIPFNGVVVTFTPNGESPITLKVRNHSEAGNTRPDIDVTTGADTRRKVLPGLADAQKHTFEVVVDGASERADIVGLLDDCASGALVVAVTQCGDGGATNVISENAWCTGVQYAGELDGVFTYSVEFTVAH